MDGFIVIDKPAGMTSHDVVSAVRRITGQKKVGHTGTLDPFATGVLPVALGEGTKAIPFLDESIKEYRAVMVLGVATDTQDCTGSVVHEGDWSHVTPGDLEDLCRSFTGTSTQIPPMFSALKRNGVPLYKLARQGIEVLREPRAIEIFSLVLDDVKLPQVAFTVSCSRGSYIRTLANDMGERLGSGAHLLQLRRTRSGPFCIGNAITLERWAQCVEERRTEDVLISPYGALAQLKDFPLTAKGAAMVAHGIFPVQDVFQETSGCVHQSGELARLSIGGTLLGVAEICTPRDGERSKNSRLLRVFNQHNSFT